MQMILKESLFVIEKSISIEKVKTGSPSYYRPSKIWRALKIFVIEKSIRIEKVKTGAPTYYTPSKIWRA